jgi:transcriptional regulator with XRE-family HTH domain
MADEDILLALGKRIRAVRLRAGLDQRSVAAAADTSPSTVGRMELGRGGRVPLDTWLGVARVLGLPPLGWSQPEVPYGIVLEHLCRAGGWRRSGFRADALVVDREPRPMPGLPNVQLPAERAVLIGLPVLSDPAAEWHRLQRAIADVRHTASEGRSVSGVLVVARHGSNTRVAGPSRGRSDGPWLRALRDPGVAMPGRMGWVWLAPRGTHLLPGG